MRAIAVDDELYMLETLEEAISASSDITKVERFTSCSAALAYVTENPVDIAFLDINMRGIGGLGLAEKLIALQPRCKIVFCTGYGEYAVSAFQLHVSGYLMKPITAEAVQKEIDYIEEYNGKLHAYEFKYNPRKPAKVPKDFAEAHPDASFTEITPENIEEFLLSH